MRTVLISIGMVFGLSAMAAAADDAVIIRNLKQPGHFEVQNMGPDISLRWRIEVQKRVEGVWKPMASDVRLDEKCGVAPKSNCRILKSGEKIQPLPYDGYTCSTKCPPGCKGNAYLGPGEFRLVVANCAGAKKFIGTPFRFP